MSITEMYYDMLLGHIGLYDEGKQLHSMKEVADFIHTHGCGYIAEEDGTPLLEFENSDPLSVRITGKSFSNKSLPSLRYK